MRALAGHDLEVGLGEVDPRLQVLRATVKRHGREKQSKTSNSLLREFEGGSAAAACTSCARVIKASRNSRSCTSSESFITREADPRLQVLRATRRAARRSAAVGAGMGPSDGRE